MEVGRKKLLLDSAHCMLRKKDREDHKEFDQKLMDELGFLDKDKKKQKQNMTIEVDDPEDDFGDFNMFTAV